MIPPSSPFQEDTTTTCLRFLAREFEIAGKTSMEMAQVDEIVDVLQDAITATYKAWYFRMIWNDFQVSHSRYAKSKEELVKLTEQTYVTMLVSLNI